MVHKTYEDGDDATVIAYMGGGKTVVGGLENYKILHSVDSGTTIWFTTETVKEQVKKDMRKFEDDHHLRQACIEVSKDGRFGMRVLKRLFSRKKRLLILSHSNANGLKKLILEKGSLNPVSFYLLRILGGVERFIIDEADGLFGNEKSKKFESLGYVRGFCESSRVRLKVLHEAELGKHGASRICYPKNKASLLLMTGTPYNVVDNSLLNMFSISNPHVDPLVVKKLKKNLVELKLAFKKTSKDIITSQEELNRIEELCDAINVILHNNWRNIYVAGPDRVEKSVNVNKIYVMMGMSDVQKTMYKEELLNYGIVVSESSEEELEGEGEAEILGMGSKTDISNVPTETSKRMTLNRRSPKIFDDPNVLIMETYDTQDERFEHMISEDDIPKVLFVKILSRIGVSNKLKTLMVGRIVKCVEWMADHIQDSLSCFHKKTTPIYVMTGGTKSKDREPMIQKFRDSTSPSFFVSTAEIISKGANIQCADQMYISGFDFNPAKEDQLDCRTDRFGRTSDLLICKSVAANSIQEDTFIRYLLKFYVLRKVLFKQNISPPSLSKGAVSICDYFKCERERKSLEEFSDKWVVKCYDHYKMFSIKKPASSDEDE